MEDSEAIRSVVSGMVDAVNRADFAEAASYFTAEPLIVEDIAPFRWRGASAVADWLSAMGANAASMGVSLIEMTLHPVERLEIQAGCAYACFPGTLRMSVTGGELHAKGVLTFVLVNVSSGWLIDTLVWSGSRAK
jgi:ketosteroid isomerase-like protein